MQNRSTLSVTFLDRSHFMNNRTTLHRIRKWLLVFSIAVIVISIDQITKNWVIGNLELYESIQPIPALVPLFQITRSYNTGAAFGVLPNAGDIFMVLAVFIIGGLLIYYWRSQTDDRLLLLIALGLVVGGALGNILDRMQHGHVIDFIHYRIPGIISNVSNLADHSIVSGVFLLMFDNWLQGRKQKIAEEQVSEATTDSPPTEHSA